MDSSNKSDNGDQSEPAIIGWLARVIAGVVRVGRSVKDRLRRSVGMKKRGRYAPLVDMPSAAGALTPRVINPVAAKTATASPAVQESAPRTPFNHVPLEEEEQPAIESPEIVPGKPLPFKKTADFQASETGSETDHEMIARIQARRMSSATTRRGRALLWTGRRKVARLHRRFHLWQVATFYLICAGTISFLVSQPFLSTPTVIAKSKARPSAPMPTEDPRRLLEEIAQLISQKKYDEAQKSLERLRGYWPNDARVYQVQGALLAGKKDYPGARKAFEKALEVQPEARSVLFNLAEVDFVSGNYAAAEAGYKKLTGTWSKNGMILFRVYLCDRMQKHDEDAAEIEKSPGLKPGTVEWLYVQAAKNILDEKKPVGMQYVEKARLLYPEDGKICELTLQRMGLIK